MMATSVKWTSEFSEEIYRQRDRETERQRGRGTERQCHKEAMFYVHFLLNPAFALLSNVLSTTIE